MTSKPYAIRANVWLYPGAVSPWHFITLPKKESIDIKARFSKIKRGWGSLPVTVTVGKTRWRTSIFPDKKSGGYLLPLKAEVRKKEGIRDGDTITLILEIRRS